MVDIGLFNYVKNAIERGETKDSIIATLSASNWSREDIEDAYTAVVNNVPPAFHLHDDVPNGVPADGVYASSTTRSHELEWVEFRSKFWTYFIASIVLGYFTRIPYIGSLFGLGVFICLIAVAYQLASIVNDVRGRSGIGIGVVGFFLPPIGFYMAFSAAKKAAWDVAISIFEHVVLWIFFVIYILRVVVIIGVITALFLAGGHIGMPAISVNGHLVTQNPLANNTQGDQSSYAIMTTTPASCPTCSVQSTLTRSAVLPDSATVVDLGNGMKRYSNPRFHFSFDFPSDVTVNLSIRSSPTYGVTLNSGDSTLKPFSVSLYDQNDPFSTYLRGKPTPYPSTGTQSVTASGTTFVLWDNVASAQKVNSNQFEVEAVTPDMITVVPGDIYSLQLASQFTTATDSQKYSTILTQMASSFLVK